MIRHSEALKRIRRFSNPLGAQTVLLKDAHRSILAEDVYAPGNIPAFDNSAVDGYAVGKPGFKKAGTGNEGEKLKVQEEIRAGAKTMRRLESGAASRIFTGAPVPSGVWSVVMQEHTVRENGHVSLLKSPHPGANIRRSGEDVKKGALLIKKGTELEPQHLGLLAASGFSKVLIIRRPLVSILATGTELVSPGLKLNAGQIYDSNSVMLETLAAEARAIPKTLRRGRDEKEILLRKIRQGLQSDVLLIAGGVSVGRYDYVKDILKQLGVREIFWKVSIKPGKPLYFGIKDGTLVFGLPGNPVSVFVTFHEYVRPALQRLQGRRAGKDLKRAVIAQDYDNGPRRNFLRVRYSESAGGSAKVTPLEGQGSHMIGSLAKADAILEIPPSFSIRRGQNVTVKMVTERF